VRHAAGLGAATSVRFVPITLPAAKVPNPSGDLGATPGQCWAAARQSSTPHPLGHVRPNHFRRQLLANAAIAASRVSV
jgi:hypothetical protein